VTGSPPGLAEGGVVDAWWIDVRGNAARGFVWGPRGRRDRLEQTLRERQVARQAVRRVLAQALSLPADDLQLQADARGRPYIRAPHGHLDVSLSRSCGRAVAVLCKTGPVGVDVECTSRALDYDAIARRFFSARENEELDRLAPAPRRERFFELWTWKEAVLKTAGLGLSEPLPRAGGSANGPARLAPRLLRDEHCVTARPEPGYVVTIVAAHPGATIRWQCDQRRQDTAPQPSEDQR
jgi:4'-phosphopantetheinyl transferase